MPASRPKRQAAICLIFASVLSSVISLPATGQNNSSGTEVDRTPNTQPTEGTGATKARQPSVKHTNQLAKESSPYLLQHAHNPVDWYPWGEEAFAKAKREGKMVFLSVGYAACHWCHVMERESFEDPEIAKQMNEKFVCVKVDREERPDVDQIYMTAVQMISGNGGWPMSVFLLPDGRPFWGGTYFPARTGDRGNSVGFLSVMDQIDKAWKTQRDAVTQQATTLTAAVKANQNPEKETPDDDRLDESLIAQVGEALAKQYDPVNGGFGRDPNRPKFPEPSNLAFLLDRSRSDTVNATTREKAKQMLLTTLDGMLSGAMYDHLGGGFHRYSVDGLWQIPHFEKMLYDNGQLASIYAEAYADTGNPEYRSVVEGICDFTLRELKAPGGAFYSALDADSEGEEGKFYRWTQEELDEAKLSSGFELFKQVFRMNGPANFEGEYYAPAPGKALSSIATTRKTDFATLQRELDVTRKQLFQIRSKRVRPITDVKILTAWNGLMISGLADAGRILDRKDYIQAAANAANFILAELKTEQGRLLRSYAAGEAKLNAYLDDYAFLVSGLIALHRATGDEKWLQTAASLTDKQIELFADQRSGGFFFTSSDHPTLIVRVKDPVDSAIPSGMSVTAENLAYLAASEKASPAYKPALESTLKSLAPLMRRASSAAPRSAAALANYLEQLPPPALRIPQP
ncbi:MAG: thioredoxin domain-containing protein [Planctomycetaceae bacterium]|nr:thioredoxin domain-containing protein [Planctomycetaceae bacterium]